MRHAELHVLTEEQRKLIEDNLDFCYYWFNLHHIYSEDKQQSLLLALCHFIHLYDSERGAITTFIGAIFESRFKSLYKYDQAEVRKINEEALSLETPLYIGDDGDTLTLEDAIESIEGGFNAVEAKMVVNNIIKNVKADATLTENQVKIFLTWVETRNYAFCGRAFGLSAQRVEQIIKKMFKIIRDHHLTWDNLDAHYQKFTYPEIKARFFALNREGGASEQAVVVIKSTAIRNRTRENRSFVISSSHPYFTSNADKLGGTKLKDRSGKRYLLSKWIKNEIDDVEAVYLL